MANVANTAIQAIVKGMEDFINRMIDGVNGIIDSINAGPGAVLGLKDFAHVTIPIPSIPLISAATGFSGVLGRDTIFQAHAGEAVDISTVAQTRRGGGGAVHNYYFQVSGSIWTTQALMNAVDAHMKNEARKRGFTGLLG
jgi:hypothetical protein